MKKKKELGESVVVCNQQTHGIVKTNGAGLAEWLLWEEKGVEAFIAPKKVFTQFKFH